VKFSRDRIFYLASLISSSLSGAADIALLKSPDDVKVEVIRALSDELKVEESIDAEVRKILGSYSRPLVEGSPEWDVLYRKTREEVSRRRFRT
jgi:hypothetical protein